MALAQYNDLYWFPDGSLAANVQARVFPRASQALAPLFTDVTGATPLANPLTTDGAGVLNFWAEEGEYWIHIDNRSFRVSVGSPGGLDVFEAAASAAVSTGIVYGGNVSIASPTSITITDFVGYVVDHTTDPIRPAITRLHQPTQTLPLVGASLTRTVTWWLVDAAGLISQQAAEPTHSQRRTHIVLAVTAFDPVLVTLLDLVAVPQILPQPMNQFLDLVDSLHPFNVSGNEITPNGVNLRIDSAAGILFQRSAGYGTTPNDPHAKPTAALVAAQFRYGLRNTVAFPPPTTLIDVANYDNGGVLTPIPGGPNVSSVHRVFKLAPSSPANQTVVQYGQTFYATLTDAINSVGHETFVINPAFITTVLVAYIAVIRTATDLSNPAQCRIIPAAKFARP